AREVQVAVDLQGPLRRVARAQVQAVDVLRDQHEALAERALEGDERPVRGVRRRAQAERTPPEVPAPLRFGHRAEGGERREALGTVVRAAHAPEAFGTTERRDAALG